MKELKSLIMHFSYGKKYLRRFYYGSDYGPKDNCQNLTDWSSGVMNSARMNNFEIVTKRVKYIKDQNYKDGYEKRVI